MQPQYGKPKGYNISQTANFTPEQMQLFSSLLSSSKNGAEGGMDFLTKLSQGDEGMFQQLEAPAYSSLEKSLGNISSRFSQVGAQDSSAFQNALAGQAGSLAENLGSQRIGLQNQSVNQLLNQSQLLLGQRPFDTQLQKKDSMDWGAIIGKLLGEAPELAFKIMKMMG